MSVPAAERPGTGPWITRSEVYARHGMAATSQPLATQAAVAILQAGGSAVDAAIAANAVLAVVEPTGCGVGGDLFALVWDAADRRLHGLNGSGRSPRGLTAEHFAARGLARVPAHGVLSISVPGCVDGWAALHRRFGKLPWRDLLATAIAHARDGFPVSEVIAHQWRANAAVLAGQPGFEAVFLPHGRAPAKGAWFTNRALADTLEAIAADGAEAFYRGAIAAELVRFVREHDGFLAADDLATHRSEWVAPIATDYRGRTVWELPPNGQGLAVLQMLNVLEAFDVAALGFGSAEHLHLLIETKKLVFEDRARFYADPRFAALPVEALASKRYAESRRALLRLDRASSGYDAGAPALEHGDTVCLATADRDGNMVSLIQSNYRGMGSGVTPPALGFGLQDRGELFDLTPGRPNSYAPGKRPFHTIIPAFVTVDGQPWLAFGVMGGAMQPQGHVQVLSNLIDFGMNLQEAGDAPRVRHTGSSQPTGERATDGGHVGLERGFADDTRAELERRGHRVTWASGEFGGYQAVMRDPRTGAWVGASESRKDGQAAGH